MVGQIKIENKRKINKNPDTIKDKDSSKHLLVLTTVPNKETAQKLARGLVEERLAACVTISSACESYYWWQDKIYQEEELILFIKTSASLFKELKEKILDLHPYQVPEIIALPIFRGYSKYLAWIDKETKPRQE